MCPSLVAAPPAPTPSPASGHPPPAISASHPASGPVRHPYPNPLPPGTSGVCPGAVKQLTPSHGHQVPAAPPGGAVGLFLSCSGCTHPTLTAAPPSRPPWGWYTPTSAKIATPRGPGECARCQSSYGVPGGNTACVPDPGGLTCVPNPAAVPRPPQAPPVATVCSETTVAPVCLETTGVLDATGVPSRVPNPAAASDRHRVPNPSEALQLHAGTDSTPLHVPNTATTACGCTFGHLHAGAASPNFVALGHHPNDQGAQISIAHECAQDWRGHTCPSLGSSCPPVCARSHQRDPTKTKNFQIGPPSTQSHSVPRDISGTTRCPTGRGALGLTLDQKSGPKVSPSGSGALPMDEYRKRITFSDAVKCAQTAPVAPHSA